MEVVNLHIKNMVCPRCIYIVENELFVMGIKIYDIELGHARVAIPEHITFDDIDERLNPYGFNILKNKNEIIVERIKIIIDEYILKLENRKITHTVSSFIAEEIGKNYNSLSKLFSSLESRTIEQYYIDKKIERIKQLLSEDELSISEIAYKLGYSSVHYLSNQFKYQTGVTPKQYKSKFQSKWKYR